MKRFKELLHIPLVIAFPIISIAILLIWITTPTKASDFAAIVSSIFSAFGVLLAYLTVRETIQDRNEKARPFVFVEFPIQANGDIDFIIQNPTLNVARNIQIEFDPVPVDFRDQKLTDWQWLNQPFDLMPGSREQNFFHQSFQLLGVAGKDIPKKFKVRVSYETILGDPCPPQEFSFDFSSRARQILPETEIDHLNTIAKELKRLSQATEKLAQREVFIIEERKEFIERMNQESEKRKEKLWIRERQMEAEGTSSRDVEFNPHKPAH